MLVSEGLKALICHQQNNKLLLKRYSMLIVFLLCLFLTSCVEAFENYMKPEETNRLLCLLKKRDCSIELVEMDKAKLPLNDATLVKLATLRKEFTNSALKKQLTPQEFTPEEIQQLFAKEWAYPTAPAKKVPRRRKK